MHGPPGGRAPLSDRTCRYPDRSCRCAVAVVGGLAPFASGLGNGPVLSGLVKQMLATGAVLAALGAVVSGHATPAMGATYRHVDAAHDAVGMPSFSGPYHNAVRNRQNDVIRLRVAHGTTRIRIGVTLRSSSMKGLRWRSIDLSLKTNEDMYEGTLDMRHKGTTFILGDKNTHAQRTCRSYRAGRNGRVLWLSFNRACLQSPRWIRAGVSVSSSTGSRFFNDNALSDDWSDRGPSIHTPRIRSSR